MKLEEYKKDSYEFTSRASNLIRHFAFAGIAIIWIFKHENQSTNLLPQELITPLLFLILTLLFDLLQYLIPSIIWTIFYKYHEKQGRHDENEIKANRWYSRPGWIFYGGKTLTLLSAYYLIGTFVIDKL